MDNYELVTSTSVRWKEYYTVHTSDIVGPGWGYNPGYDNQIVVLWENRKYVNVKTPATAYFFEVWESMS